MYKWAEKSENAKAFYRYAKKHKSKNMMLQQGTDSQFIVWCTISCRANQ